MEIVGGLRDRVTFPEGGADMEESFEKMISLKTLKELTAWIEEMGSASAAAEFKGAKAVLDLPERAPVSEDTRNIVRITQKPAPLPIIAANADSLQGKVFAVTDDGDGLAGEIGKALELLGADWRPITKEEQPDGLSDLDGLVLVSRSASKMRYTATDLFRFLKSADMEKLHWVYTFDDSWGALRKVQQIRNARLPEGFPGLIKTLCHEYPDKNLCAVRFHAPISKKTLPEVIAAELTNTAPFPEIIYSGEARYRYLPEIGPADVQADATAELGIDETSTILVLGGAQGITPALLSEFASVHHCHYVLVGRSQADQDDEAYRALETRDEIRKFLIESEGMKKPKEIESKVRRIYKTKQIAKTIKRIEQCGATASYHSVDVSDAKQFRAFLRRLTEERGGIDGVIHAAGILEDKLFRDKEIDSFERVYHTKTVPLEVIVRELLPELRLLVLFSSMSSTFGNAGQCDYAAGNSVMDAAAQVLDEKYPDLRILAFNWGPWKGAGMVNAGLESEFHKRGISLLHLEEGSTFFVNEITHGTEAGVVAIGGEEQEIGDFIRAMLQ
jgi:NAD(P)-dependent dehydrogenase (short-subunit alcohol dehydrogenase family)